MKKRNILTVVTVVTFLTFLIMPSIAVGKTKITFLSHVYKPWNDLLTEQAKRYEQMNPDVEIIYSTVLHADLHTKIMTSLLAGTGADVMGVYGPWMYELVNGGWLAPAPDWVEKDIAENFVKVAGIGATYGEKIYGYVQHVGIPTFIANVEMFEAAGINFPETYEDLLSINDKLKKEEGGILQQVGIAMDSSKSGSWNVFSWGTILKACGADILSPDRIPAFDNEAGRKATEIYSQVAYPEFKELEIPTAFCLNRVAVMFNGPWMRGFINEKAPNLKYKALPPMKGPAKQVTSMYAWFWVVNSASRVQEEAWKFIQFLSAPEQYYEMTERIGLVPFQKRLIEDPRIQEDQWILAFSQALEMAEYYYALNVPSWESIDNAIGIQLERLVGREITVDEFLSQTKAHIEEIVRDITAREKK